MENIFFDRLSLLYHDFLYERNTKRKILLQVSERTLFVRDCSKAKLDPPYSSPVPKKFKKLGWKTLEQPPDSPNLSPSDFHDFGLLKYARGGRRFSDDAQIVASVRNWLQTRLTSFFEDGISTFAGKSIL